MGQLSIQSVAFAILLAVLVYGIAHHFAGKKVNALVAEAKSALRADVKKIEDYTDAELGKLTEQLVARLVDTSAQQEAKAQADAEIARKAALFTRVQTVVNTAKAPTA